MKYLQGRKEFDLVIREDKIPIPQFNQVYSLFEKEYELSASWS